MLGTQIAGVREFELTKTDVSPSVSGGIDNQLRGFSCFELGKRCDGVVLESDIVSFERSDHKLVIE